jgi:hypothetical protein
MGARNRAFATYGGALYVSYGLLAVGMSSLLGNATDLTTNQFLTLWGEASVMLILGLMLMISGLMVGSASDFRRIAGGAVGALSAMVGVILAPVVINYDTGILSQVEGLPGVLSSAGSAQLSILYEMLFITSLATMLVAFPLGMVGSFQVLQEKETGSMDQP